MDAGKLSRNSDEVRRFRDRLLRWYDANRRDLPWRKDRQPYRVWISEIMLQQTRVAAVLEHYRRFLKRFPTVRALASAREASVLAAWSGLGYYRRARMLHQSAKLIVHDHNGKFPGSAKAWEELPGIGRYTAAAIASIAFGEAVAVVDGNVERVLERLLGKRLTKSESWRTAAEFVSVERPGDFNQALMELGATVCTPKQPACSACPVIEFCCTRGTLVQNPKELRKKKAIHYGLDLRNGSVRLVQRPKTWSLMPGMWELPEMQANGKCSFTLRHSITVTDYRVNVSYCRLPSSSNAQWVQKARVTRLPLTGLARKILIKAGVIPQEPSKSSRQSASSKTTGQ